MIADTQIIQLKRQDYAYLSRSQKVIGTKTGFGFNQIKGRITQIDERSPADKSELEIGDIIYSCRFQHRFCEEIELISEFDDLDTNLAFRGDNVTLHVAKATYFDKEIGKHILSKL